MPGKKPSSRAKRRRVCVVTGTRAEFGLLVPVMDAVKKRKELELQVVAAGAHFLKPTRTIREVEAKYTVAARVPMQMQGKTGRDADAQALGRGVEGFARAFKKLKPDWVVVLGDRIEAFAAASAASIAGIAVCHIHGGDRAEGIADEAMRHAITKLSHLHCAATKLSAERIRKMGEKPEHVHVTGSPAIDGVNAISPLSDSEVLAFGYPRAVLLLHPSSLGTREERFLADRVLSELGWCGCSTTIVLAPNADPGSAAIKAEYARWNRMYRGRAIPPEISATGRATPHYKFVDHLPRPKFIALLKWMARPRRLGKIWQRGLLIGNSSAGLVEAAAIGLPVVNIGERQAGRERADNVIDIPFIPNNMWATGPLEHAISCAMLTSRPSARHPYGDGRASPRIAALLAKTDPHNPALLRKRNSY